MACATVLGEASHVSGCQPPLPVELHGVSQHGRTRRCLASPHPREAIGTPVLTPHTVVDDEEPAGIILPLHRS